MCSARRDDPSYLNDVTLHGPARLQIVFDATEVPENSDDLYWWSTGALLLMAVPCCTNWGFHVKSGSSNG